MVDAGGLSTPRWIAKKLSPSAFIVPSSIAPDGKTMLATTVEGNNVQICVLQVPEKEGDLAVPRPITSNDAAHGLGSFSPDGHVVAYQSNEAGRPEIYVCEWSEGRFKGVPVMVSRDGGDIAKWGRDGKHLYYSSQGKLMSVEIASRPYEGPVATAGAEARPPEWDWIFALTDMKGPHKSMADLARQKNTHPVELMIDMALERDMKFFMIQPIANENQAEALELMKHPRSVVTLSYSGAHVSQIMDSSL